MDKRQLVDGCKRGDTLLKDGGVLLFFRCLRLFAKSSLFILFEFELRPPLFCLRRVIIKSDTSPRIALRRTIDRAICSSS